MRIGELLVECELITPKQLAGGLEYARAKGLPIGRVLRLLRYLNEDGLEMGLLGQRCIRGGIEAPLVVRAIKDALAKGLPFSQTLRMEQLNLPAIENGAVAKSTSKNAAELIEQGNQALNEDRLLEAEELYLSAVEACNSDANGTALELADANSRLAAFYLLTNRWDESEVLYMIALQLRQEALGLDDISIARVFEDLSDLYDVCEKYEQSMQYGLQACAVLDKHLPGSFNDYAVPLRRLQMLSKRLPKVPSKRIGELLTESSILSRDELQVALQVAKRTGKPLGSVLRTDRLVDEVDLQSVLSVQLLVKQHVLTDSIAIETLKISHRMRMPLQDVLKHFKLLGEAAEDDRLAELVVEQDRLLTAENSLGVDHPDVALIAVSLADKFFVRNSVTDAETFFKRALSIDAAGRPIDPEAKATALEKLITIYKTTGREMQAVPLLLKSLEHFSKTGQSNNPRCLPVLITLAELEIAAQSYPIAMSFLRSADALQGQIDKAGEARIPILDGLVKCMLETGMVEEAEMTCSELLSIAEQVFGPLDGQTATYMEKLGDIHALLGDTDRAKAQYVRCMQVYDYALNAAPSASALVKGKLATLKS